MSTLPDTQRRILTDLEHLQDQQGTLVSPLYWSQLPSETLGRCTVTAQRRGSLVLSKVKLKHHAGAEGSGSAPVWARSQWAWPAKACFQLPLRSTGELHSTLEPLLAPISAWKIPLWASL